MTNEEIEDKLRQGIASITSREKSSIAMETPLHEMGIDSLSFVEILVFIEKTFNLRLIELDLTKKDLETVHALASFIAGKL
jgi:acyl carrier protein